MISPEGQRGQTMVLFSLTVLLLVLMILGTIGIAVRAKQRVELQMVSDASAYSEAVLTARTFNGIAVLNRTQIAYMVAMAGTQSLISHSTLYFDAITDPQNTCSAHGGVKTPTRFPQWYKDDKNAGLQVQAEQGEAGAVTTAELALYTKLVGVLSNQNVVKQISNAAFPGGSGTGLMVPAAGASKAMAEVIGANYTPVSQTQILSQEKSANSVGVCGTGALCQSTSDLHQEEMAEYGSEGWTWVRDRPGGMSKFTGTQGVMGFSMTPPSVGDSFVASSAYDTAGAPAVVCNDLATDVGPPGATWVNSTELQNVQDEHHYALADYEGGTTEPGEGIPVGTTSEGVHTLGSCNVCDGIWPDFVGYDESLLNAKDDWGQPKLYAIVGRDFTKTPLDVWNLFFKFHFSSSGTGTPLDLRNRSGGTGLTRQVALSAAIVYYHRPWSAGHPNGWREPPNLLNPFWRATLISPLGANDDKPWKTLQGSGFPVQAGVYKNLVGKGFKGAGFKGGSR